MSGFEIAGLVLGAIPVLEKGLKYYKARSKEIVHHEESMNSLILKLHYGHLRFRRSCENVLTSLVKDNELELLLDDTNEQQWKKMLGAGLEDKLKRRLGKAFFFYIETMWEIALHLAKLRKVIGLTESERWYTTRSYSKPKWHRETWKILKDCLQHSSHRELLAAIDAGNDQLEKILPTVAPEPVVIHARKSEMDRWDSIRRSAKSLYCALCSGWLCQCSNHAAQLQLENRVATGKGGHEFKVALSSAGGHSTAATSDAGWKKVVVTPDDEDNADPPDRAARVDFAVTTATATTISILPIADLCNSLSSTVHDQDRKCLGFLTEDTRKHYVYLLKPPSTSCNRNVVSLFELLQKNGRITVPAPMSIELLDRYELALLLASSLLQLHATSWMNGRWSGEDIQFVPSNPGMHVSDCAFVTKNFPPKTENQATSAPTSLRPLAIRNEAIFALGVTLLELSILAPLDSKMNDLDRKIPDLADYQTAIRLLKEIERNNVREWNSVVDICLRCGFHKPADFGKKEFRQEYFECVVTPLQRLYDDAK